MKSEKSLYIEFFMGEKTIFREDLQEGDCIKYLYEESIHDLRTGIIQSFIHDSNKRKSIVILTDGKHIPLNWVHHRIKSNQIEITK